MLTKSLHFSHRFLSLHSQSQFCLGFSWFYTRNRLIHQQAVRGSSQEKPRWTQEHPETTLQHSKVGLPWKEPSLGFHAGMASGRNVNWKNHLSVPRDVGCPVSNAKAMGCVYYLFIGARNQFSWQRRFDSFLTFLKYSSWPQTMMQPDTWILDQERKIQF